MTWISPVWYLLLGPAAAGALWARYRTMRRAAGLGMVRPTAWLRLRWALIFCGGFWLFTFLSAFYETALWPPIGAALLVVGMALLLRAARAGVHPGLRGFHFPLPADGVDLIAREVARLARRPLWRLWAWRLAPISPLLALLVLGASSEASRWLLWLALGSSLSAPLLLIAYRSAWVGPLSLLLVSGALGWHAFNLRAELPPGTWTTPWSGARCTARVVPAGDGTAWCVNAPTETIYHYHLTTGVVLEQYRLADSWDVFAANQNGAWIEQIPTTGLVHVGRGTAQVVDAFFHPILGDLTAEDALWFVGGLGRLGVYSDSLLIDSVNSQNRLLGEWVVSVTVLPDQSVWVGSTAGVSVREPTSGQWRTYDKHRAGLQGSVAEVAAGPDGTVWTLQTHISDDSFWRSWGLSVLRPDGTWLHVNLWQVTGLEAPARRDSLTVDGHGRAWFIAVSCYLRERFLGVVNPDGSLAHLGSLGSATNEPHGIFSDGAGGVFLYNGEREPLRHWRP